MLLVMTIRGLVRRSGMRLGRDEDDEGESWGFFENQVSINTIVSIFLSILTFYLPLPFLHFLSFSPIIFPLFYFTFKPPI